jgi:hypothetical protein
MGGSSSQWKAYFPYGKETFHFQVPAGLLGKGQEIAMPETRRSPPDAARHRFAFRQGAIMLAFGLAVFAAAWWVPPSPALRWLLVALPIALLALWAWEFFKVIRDDDEMMQGLALRAISFSGVLVLLLATMWGMLERLVGAPQLPLFLLMPGFAAVYGIVSTIMGTRR